MRTLIFDSTLTGHHLEYLHHLYEGAIIRSPKEYIFAVPHNEWEKMRGKREWLPADNIQWFMLNDDECASTKGKNLLIQSYKISRLIKRVSKEVGADNIFLISLAGAVPFLPLMLSAKIKLSGIIYKIYLRSPKKGIRRLLDNLRYLIMSKNISMKNIFILNDPRSTKRLNELYHSDKFISLPDPVPSVNKKSLRNLRNDFGISDKTTIFLHFGAMDKRKGTIEILKALCLMNPNEHFNKTFVFAGCIKASLKHEFYNLVHSAKLKNANIVVIDEFCTYDFLNSLCYTADCILIPYLITDLSSGALGYAAVHETPVIGPKDGLIGELINDNNLGTTIAQITPNTIKNAIVQFNPHHSYNDYAQKNSITSFIKNILD